MTTFVVDMNQIPDKVLGKILALCPPEDLSKLEQVSPRWRKVVGKHCGILMVKGNQLESYEIIQPKSSLSRLDLSSAYAECITAISEHKLVRRSKESLGNGDHIHVEGPRAAGDNGKESPANPTPTKRTEEASENIRKLCIIGTISLPEISILINGCRNLRALHIHISTLATIPRTTKNLVMDIPTLKILFIDSFVVKELYKKMEGSLATLDFKFGIGVAAIILESNYFPHLETLLVDLPYSEAVERRVTKGVSEFLSKHHDTIKSLGLHQTFLLNIPDEEDTLGDGSENEEEEDDSSESSEYTVSLRTLALCAKQLKEVTLEEINIRLACQQDSAPLWKNFILFQTGLRKLIYVGNSRIPFPSRTIQENGAVLGTLILETRDSIDLAPLQSCKVLQKLVLLTHPNQLDEDDEELEICSAPTAPSSVRNAHLLPPSLESISFRHLLVKRSDVEAIVCSGRLHNLRKLEFYSCGNEMDYGVPIQVLGRIVREKRLQKFSIKYSLNAKSLTDKMLPSDVALLALTIKNNYSITGFEIQGTLSPSGDEYLSSKSSWEETAQKVVAGTDVFEFPDETIPYGGTFVETFGFVEEETEMADPEEDDDDDETMGTETEDEDDTTGEYCTVDEDIDEIDVDDLELDGEDMDQNQ